MRLFAIFLGLVTMAISSAAVEDFAQNDTPSGSQLNKRDNTNMTTWAHADSSQTTCNETDRMESSSVANWTSIYVKDCGLVASGLPNGTWSINNLTTDTSDHGSGWYWLVTYTTCNFGIHPYNAPSGENTTVGDADVKYIISQAMTKFAVNETFMNASFGTLNDCPTAGHNLEWILTNSTADAVVSTNSPSVLPQQHRSEPRKGERST